MRMLSNGTSFSSSLPVHALTRMNNCSLNNIDPLYK